MCGILFALRPARSGDSDNADEGFLRLLLLLKVANAARGPDAQETLERNIQDKNGAGNFVDLTFFASELRLRGDKPVVQPHFAGCDGDVLCWNGEVFDGLDVSAHENDGVKLFSKLQTTQTPEGVRDVFGSIEGPYAFVFYQHSTRLLYFGRDPLGRRSLLIHKPNQKCPYFLLASVSAGVHPGYEFDELPTQHIYCLGVAQAAEAIQSTQPNIDQALRLIPRCSPEQESCLPFARPSNINRTIVDDPPLPQSLDVIPGFLVSAVDGLIIGLDRSVRLRVHDVPRSTESEGSSRIAILFSGGIDSTFLAFLANRHIPPDEPIDLLNVAFENPRKLKGNQDGIGKKQRRLEKLRADEQARADVSYLVPDRVTGLKEVEELRRLCPQRTWNFVEIDVPHQEYQEARSTVEALMLPGRTVMDLSLAMALYFAARGTGTTRNHTDAEPQPYTSPARVLLNGLGSDELFGGYGRHRTAYANGGWKAVVDELQLELDRIPTRNLGRDDRVISSHGKETRHPFLSLSVVDFAAQLPVHHKMDPRLEQGVGDKMLLRLAARKLGLVEASERKKRAMQFGSHSARMESGDSQKSGDILLS